MFRSKNRFGGTANTVAMFVEWAGDPYQEALLAGAHETAQLTGTNLLCFIGGRIPEDPSAGGRHRVYELAGPHVCEAVVLVASPLSHEVGSEGLARYCHRYGELPLCSIGVDLGPGSITVANESGMTALVSHLIVVHGARRLAFIRGPRVNAEAEVREQAYRTALERHGIPFDLALVALGDFSAESGRSALLELEQSGQDLRELDAVIASNDNMAIGALGLLAERGIGVPSPVRVVGFDDIEDAHLTQPALTTVRQPMSQQGGAAVRLALDAIRERQSLPAPPLPTELIVRGSCGCGETPPRPPSIVPDIDCGFDSALVLRRQRILDSVTRAAHGAFGAAGVDWQERLLNALLEDLRVDGGVAFVTTLQDVMARLLGRGVDPGHCDQVLDALRAQLVPLLRTDNERRARAEDLFHLARQAISRTLQRVMTRAHLNLNRWVRNISVVCTSLATAADLGELRRRLFCQLRALGVRSGFVVLYDTGVAPHDARLLAGFDQATGCEWLESAPFAREELLPPSLVHAADQGRSFAVLPLIAGERALGHALLELDPRHSCAYGPLADAISGAVRASKLFESLHPLPLVS